MSQKLILTCIKNEGAFLLDWVAHNLSLGFDHVYIFSNDCSDGSDALGARLQDLGIATHIPNSAAEGNGPQWAALNHDAVATIPIGDWIFMTDPDEYLNIHCGNGRVTDLIAQVPEAGAISIPWRFFGSNGAMDFSDEPTPQRFPATAPYPMFYPRQAYMFKTLYCKTDAIQKPGVHAPRLKKDMDWRALNWVNGNGMVLTQFDPKTPILAGPNAGIELAQINHYALRSAKSFLVKAERGLANRKSARIDLTYWMRRNFNTLHDPSILRYAELTAKVREKLMSDPKLAELHTLACLWHRERAEQLAATPEGLNLLSGIQLAGDSKVLDQPQAARLFEYHRAVRHAELGT